jgi:hypothetical protein
VPGDPSVLSPPRGALTFDLVGEETALAGSPGSDSERCRVKILAGETGFRLLLVTLGAEARLSADRVGPCLALQALTGCLRLHFRGESLDVPMGALLVPRQAVVYQVEALVDSTFLLSLGPCGT